MYLKLEVLYYYIFISAMFILDTNYKKKKSLHIGSYYNFSNFIDFETLLKCKLYHKFNIKIKIKLV